MADLADAFDQLMDFGMWERVLVILAGFLAPTVLRDVTKGFVPDSVDHREVYGLAVVAGGQFSPMYSNEISLGGGVYTADAAAERFGIKETIVGGGN